MDADTIAQLKSAARQEAASPSKRQRTAATEAGGSSEAAERLERNLAELIKLSDEKVEGAGMTCAQTSRRDRDCHA